MAFIETKHTFAAIDIIKKELSKIANVLSIILMILFSLFYVGSIIININSIFHIIAYSVLLLAVIVTFIVETALKIKNSDFRKEARIKEEKRRLAILIIKIIRYLTQFAIISVALIFSFVNNSFDSNFLIAIVTGVIWVLSIIMDIVLSTINKYVDYLKIGFKLDFDESFATKIIFSEQYKLMKMENKKLQLEHEKKYTDQEYKIVSLLIERAEQVKSESKKEIEEKLKILKDDIKKLNDRNNLSKKQKLDIENKYNENKRLAAKMVEDKKQVEKFLLESYEFIKKLPINGPVYKAFKMVPLLLLMVKYYFDGKYKEIPVQTILSIIAAITYFITPLDAIPDMIPVAGHIDDLFVFNLCLESIEHDLKKFMLWYNK